MSEIPAPDADPDYKRVVKVHVRITLKGGDSLFYRHMDVNKAHAQVKYILTKMYDWYAKADNNPILETQVMKDEFVSFDKKAVSNVRNEVVTSIGYGKTPLSSSGIHLGEIAFVGVVCPACRSVVEDSMPGHTITEDGDCTDRLIVGDR